MSDSERKRITERFRTFSLDLPETPADAIALMREGRTTCPVAHSQMAGGFFAFLRDEDVRKGMTDWQTFASSPANSRPLAARPEDQFRMPAIDYDGEEHAYWRRFFTSIITTRHVARVKPLLTQDVTNLVDQMAARGHADLATEFGDHIPALAVFYLLGIDDSKAQKAMFSFARAMVTDFKDPIARERNILGVARFALAEIDKRRISPRDDILTEIAQRQDVEPIDEDQFGKIIFGLVGGGIGTTAAAITDLFHEVLSRPDIKKQLIDNPSLVPNAVEESLRLHAPSMGLFRRVTKPTVVSGELLPEGSSVLMCWQSANLDPEVYDDPLAFRLDRSPNRHMSFGLGRHFCPGSPLARMELTLVLETMLLRHPEIRLNPNKIIESRFIGLSEAVIPSLPVLFS